MSSSTQVITFADIYTEILNKMKQPTSNTAITAQAKRYANTGLHDMVLGFEYKLPWLERESFITTRAPYTTGTVSIARGSQSLTGTSTVWNSSDTFGIQNVRTIGKLNLGDSNIYTAASVGGAGTITLNQKYVGSEDLVAGEYTYFEDEYDLASDFLKPIDFNRFFTASQLQLIGREKFRQQFPRPNIADNPTVATLLDRSFSGTTVPVVRVQFYPYPNDTYIIPYAYVTSSIAVTAAGAELTYMTNDTDEPALPVRYRNAIVEYAIWKWYRDKKDDNRSELAKADYQDTVNRIVGDQRIGANTQAQLAPRVGVYTARSKPYRSRGRFSTNNSFDDFRT